MTTGNAETFNVESRKTGRHNCRVNRNNKKIPGNIYGPKVDNLNVLVDELFIEKHRGPKYESTIFKTQSDDSKMSGINVLLKRVDYHPVTRRPVHVDFYAPDMTKAVRVKVNITFEGEPIGCKEEGGVQQTILHEIEIECSPNDIPETISVDVSHLALNSSLHVSEITFPAGVTPITAPERTIVTVNMPKEEPAPEEVAAAAEGAEGAEGAAAAPAEGGDAKKEEKAEEKK